MEKPNIVLITCHDLGRHINTYGVSTVSTPFMNKIARDGLSSIIFFVPAQAAALAEHP